MSVLTAGFVVKM